MLRAVKRLGGLIAVIVSATLTLGGIVAAPGAGAATQAPDKPPSEALLLVVDFSGSMLESDGSGSTRIASAKKALQTIIAALPADLDVGMRAYGHRVPSSDKAKACQDTQLVVPVGPLDRASLSATVDGLDALGETPIGLSLQQAASDLPEDKPTTIILVSDGADECYPDLGPEPCQVTKDLVASGIDLQMETIGLQVEPRGRAQLECMAAAGGGQFTSVQDAGLLAEALAAARARADRTFEPRGDPVQGSSALIDAPQLEPGTYTDSILSTESLWFAVDAAKGQDVTARLTIKTADVPATAKVGIEWQDTRARRVDVKSLPSLTSGQASTIAVSTGKINGTRSTYGGVRDAGLYYFNLRTSGFPENVEHPFVLEIFVDGEGVPGASGTASPTTEVGDDDPTSTGTAAPLDLPDAPDGGGGGGILLFVAFLLLLAVVGYLLWRRRQKTLEGPPPPSY